MYTSRKGLRHVAIMTDEDGTTILYEYNLVLYFMVRNDTSKKGENAPRAMDEKRFLSSAAIEVPSTILYYYSVSTKYFVVPPRRVARRPRFAASSCRSSSCCRLLPSSCRMSPCCPLPLLCVVVSPVAFVLSRRRVARRRRRAARRRDAPSRRGAARCVVARRRRRAASSYRPSPLLCCPSPC